MHKVLQSYLDTGKLPHALLLTGGSDDFLFEEAKNFVHTLYLQTSENCAHKVLSGNSIDFFVLEPSSKAGVHQISDIRWMCEQAASYPHESPKKCFVIRHADRMMAAAASAFLKTLEEPNATTLFLLLSENPGAILPTIISRVQKVNFTEEEEETISQAVMEKLEELFTSTLTYNELHLVCTKIQELVEKESAKKEETFQVLGWFSILKIYNYMQISMLKNTEGGGYYGPSFLKLN